jgi:hypothetical protein
MKMEIEFSLRPFTECSVNRIKGSMNRGRGEVPDSTNESKSDHSPAE